MGVAANILNKSEQLTVGGPPAWGLDGGQTTAHHNKTACYEMLYRVSDLTNVT